MGLVEYKNQSDSRAINIGSIASFWAKHKNKIYGAILLVVGALGGNVDRVNEAVGPIFTSPNTNINTTEIYERIENAETRLNALEQYLENAQTNNNNRQDIRIPIK